MWFPFWRLQQSRHRLFALFALAQAACSCSGLISYPHVGEQFHHFPSEPFFFSMFLSSTPFVQSHYTSQDSLHIFLIYIPYSFCVKWQKIEKTSSPLIQGLPCIDSLYLCSTLFSQRLLLSAVHVNCQDCNNRSFTAVVLAVH